MESLEKRIRQFGEEFERAYQNIGADSLIAERTQLASRMAQPDFWNDSSAAQDVSKRFARLDARVGPWALLKESLDELREMALLNDVSLEAELSEQCNQLEASFAELKRQLKYAGPYDAHDAIVTISAGAGGTDAQDWAGMLERMYLRWAERNNIKADIIDRSPGEEAGLKSVSFELSGSFVYARMKGEHGVHRLVRLSPFNADSLRQTSFAKVEVVPVIDEPGDIQIDDQDLKIDVYRSGGKGGQSVNTTDSAVRITHVPTGIVVAIQNERSQLQNKEKAMQILRSKLAQLKEEQHKEAIADLKGPNEQAAWGNQIRSYVLHPYKMVKDLRTNHETSDTEAVLDGDLNDFIDTYLEHTLST